jgi:hypothetical protein
VLGVFDQRYQPAAWEGAGTQRTQAHAHTRPPPFLSLSSPRMSCLFVEDLEHAQYMYALIWQAVDTAIKSREIDATEGRAGRFRGCRARSGENWKWRDWRGPDANGGCGGRAPHRPLFCTETMQRDWSTTQSMDFMDWSRCRLSAALTKISSKILVSLSRVILLICSVIVLLQSNLLHSI